MTTFPERLRALRNGNSLSQKELAEQVELKKSAISMYERGEREPRRERIE
jgi:transcriptional regulator with XRE-family HTH domain